MFQFALELNVPCAVGTHYGYGDGHNQCAERALFDAVVDEPRHETAEASHNQACAGEYDLFAAHVACGEFEERGVHEGEEES